MNLQQTFQILTKMIFPFIFISMVLVFVYAFIQENSLVLPGEKAPFAEGQETPELMAKDVDLSQQHRTESDIAEWLEVAVVESYTLNVAGYKDQLENVKKHFSDQGYKEFLNHLQKSKLYDSMRSSNISANAFMEGKPTLLNKGVIGDRYRWLFEVPVTIGYVPLSARGYKKNEQPLQNRISVRVQVGRVGNVNDPDKILIETWSVSTRR